MKKTLKDIKTLVLMQFKNKTDLSFLHSKKKTFFRIALSLLGFVGLTAVIYLIFYLCSIFRFFSFGSLIPISVLNVIFTVFMILSIVATSVGLMKSLFFSPDNQFLLTLPVGRTSIFVSKLIVYYISDFFRFVFFVVPLMVAFGIVNSLPVYFYFWLIPCVILVAAIPVAVGALLSIPLMLVTMIFKQNKVVEVVSVVVCIALIAAAIIYLISIIPSNINIVGNWSNIYWDIQAFLSGFSKVFLPFYWLTSMMVGTTSNLTSVVFTSNTPLYFFGTIGVVFVVLLFAFFLVRPLFFKMASKPFEYKKREVKKTCKNEKRNPFLSGIRKELIELFRTPSKLYSLLFVALLLPIAILFLNKIFSAMSVRLVGTYMGIVFNILIILLILLSSSSNLSKVLSEEGASHYLHKTNPQSLFVSIIPKFVNQAVVMTISLAVTIVVLGSFTSISTLNLVVLFFLCFFLYVGHLLLSVEYDIMSPTYDQYQTTGQGTSKENKSVMMAFLISFLVAAFSYLLINESSTTVYIKVCGFALVFLIYRIYMFCQKVRFFYLQPYGEGR